MGNVYRITADMDVVQVLEDLLEYAKQGELTGMASVCVFEDGQTIIDGYAGIQDYAMPVLAGLDVLKDRVKFGCIEIPERDRLIDEL